MNARSPARQFGRTGVAVLFRHCGGCSAQVPLSEWQEGPLGCDDCRAAARDTDCRAAARESSRDQNPINSSRKGQPMSVQNTLRPRPAQPQPANDAAAKYREVAAFGQVERPRVTIDAGLGQEARLRRNVWRGLTALIFVEIIGLVIAAVWLIGSYW